MEQREKLIELIGDSLCCPKETDCADCEYKKYELCTEAMVADHLLANDVVVLPCRCGECSNRHDELICPMVISHESFDEDDGYDVWYEDLTTDDFYCANGERKGGDE